MAKYKLTMVYELEDNEQAPNESETERYLEYVITRAIVDWDHVEATLIVDKEKSFSIKHSAADNVAKFPNHPWYCSMDRLPIPEDVHVIACEWNENYQMWINYDIYEFRSDEQVFIDDQEIPCKLYPSPNVWWRTVSEPEPLNKLRKLNPKK